MTWPAVEVYQKMLVVLAGFSLALGVGASGRWLLLMPLGVLAYYGWRGAR